MKQIYKKYKIKPIMDQYDSTMDQYDSTMDQYDSTMDRKYKKYHVDQYDSTMEQDNLIRELDQYEKYFLWIDRYGDGKLKEIRNGWSHGELYRAWYPDGQIKYECSFSNNEFRRNKTMWRLRLISEKLSVWYPDGRIQLKYDGQENTLQYRDLGGQLKTLKNENFLQWRYGRYENEQLQIMENDLIGLRIDWYPEGSVQITEDGEKIKKYVESKNSDNGPNKQDDDKSKKSDDQSDYQSDNQSKEPDNEKSKKIKKIKKQVHFSPDIPAYK